MLINKKIKNTLVVFLIFLTACTPISITQYVNGNEFTPMSNPPSIMYEKPKNQTTAVPIMPKVEATIRDIDGDQMIINFSSNYTGTWVDYQTNTSLPYGLNILDSYLSTVTTEGKPAYYDDNYIYVASDTGGISAYTFDGEDLTRIANRKDGSAKYTSVHGDGTYIYTACYEEGIRAYTFDGGSFTLVATKKDGGVWSNYHDIWTDGTYVYAACEDDGIRVYTFNGMNFTLVSTKDDGGYYVSVWGDSEYIYTACWTSGIRAYTFNGVSFTLKHTHLISGGTYYNLFLHGDYIYASVLTKGVAAYKFNNVTEQFSMRKLLSDITGPRCTYVKSTDYGEYVFIADRNTGIHTYSFYKEDFTFINVNNIGNQYFNVFGDKEGYVYYQPVPSAGSDTLYVNYFDDGRNFRTLNVKDDSINYYGIWGSGNYTYVAQDDGLNIYRFNGSGSRTIWEETGYQGNNFTFIDSHDDAGTYSKIWGDGTYIYVTGSSPSLRVYYFDGYTLAKIDDYDDGTIYTDIWGDGTYIYTLNYANGIKAFSFDGSNFTLIDSKDDGNNYVGISGDGAYIYAACSSDGIYAYDFDGSTLTLLEIYYEYSGEYNDIWCDGTYIYVAGNSSSLRAFTFNGVTFNLVKSEDDGNEYREIWGDGSMLFFAGDDGIFAYSFNGVDFVDRDNTMYWNGETIDTYDISSNGSYIYAATEKGLIAYEFTPRVIEYNWKMSEVIRNNRKYWWKVNATDGINNVSEVFWFITENNNPDFYNEWPPDESTNISLQPVVNITINDIDKDILEITFASNYTGIWTNYKTYRSYYDLINSHDAGGEYQNIWTDGTYIYVACMDDGLRAYTFDGNAFTLKATKDDGGNYRDVWSDGTYVYIACDTSGIRAYTFNGTTFTLLDTNYVSGSYRNVWGDGTYIYVACFGAGIRAYTFNGAIFSLITTRHDGGAYTGVMGNGTHIYAACGTSGIRAYTFNGISFSLISTKYDGGEYRNIWIKNSYIYVACMGSGLRAYTFGGSSFTLKDSIHDGGNYRNVWADDYFIYVTCETDGIRAYSFNGTSFSFETSYDVNPPYGNVTQDDGGSYIGIYGDGNYIYVGCDTEGIRAYTFGLYNFSWNFNGANIEGTNYFWRVYANDGATTKYETFKFKTTGERPPIELPQLTIMNATDVLSTRATLNCLLFDGYEDCNFYFEYDENYEFKNKTTNRTRSTGYVSETIVGLEPSTQYYFRAYAENRMGAVLSSNLSFTTRPEQPSNFEVLDFNETHANLSWTKGQGATHTIIIAKIGNWPENINDGRIVCNTTDTEFTDYAIEQHRSVYYRAWSYSSSTNLYSIGTASATTSEFFFDLLFPTYLEVGDYIFGFGMMRDRYENPVLGYIANTTLKNTDDEIVLGPVFWNCTSGNYQVAMSTTTLAQGEYTIVVVFKNEFDTTYVFTRTIFLSIAGTPDDTIYVAAWIYYTFYDIQTGTGLDDNFYKVYISYDDNFSAGDRVKGGKIGVLQSTQRSITTGQRYYMQIRDYNNNILPLGQWDPEIFTMHSTPPISNAYVSFLVTSPEFYVDLGIYMNQFRIKNMNSSTTYVILRRTDGNPGQILGRFIPPWEEIEVFVPDGYYNLTIDYYYNHNRTMYARVYPWDPYGFGTSVLIDTDTFYWIQGYNLEDVITGIEVEGTWLYYSIFDMNTGTNLGDDFYKVYISKGTNFTHVDRIKGGRFKCTIGDELHIKITDYWNNQVYPTIEPYENITIVHAKTFIDLGIPLNQFLIKNTNVSLIYFRMTDGDITNQTNNTWYNRWIPPGESTELFVRSGIYNISLEYYYPHNATFIQFENLTNYTINRDLFFVIRGHNAKIYFNFFNTNTGLGLPYEILQIYLNELRIPDNFIETTMGKVLNMVVKDYYGYVLHDSNHTISAPLTYVDLGLTFFSYKFANTKNNPFIVGMKRAGASIWWEKIIMPYETIEFLPPMGEYNVRIYNSTLSIEFNETVNSSKAYYLEGAVDINVTQIIEGQQIIIGKMVNITTEFNYTNSMLWEVIGDSYYMNQTIQSILNEFRQPHLWQIPRVTYVYEDKTPPKTSIYATVGLDGEINVYWHSTDNVQGNVDEVILYYKIENASIWKEWHTNMSATGSVKFTSNESELIAGNTYYFKALGTDKNGNIELEGDANVCSIIYAIVDISTAIDSIGIMQKAITDWYFIIIVGLMILVLIALLILERKKERLNEEKAVVYVPSGQDESFSSGYVYPEEYNGGPYYRRNMGGPYL